MLKVLTGAGVGGALAVIFSWILRTKFGVAVPEDVQTAFASVFSAFFASADEITRCLQAKRVPPSPTTTEVKEPTP